MASGAQGPGQDRPPADAGRGSPPAGAGPVYTRAGDAGQTGLRGGQRLSKSDPRVEAYGTVDELNAAVGVAREAARDASSQDEDLAVVVDALLEVQHRLLTLGSALASLPADLPATQRRITQDDVVALEQAMDRCSAELAPLASFVLPGGCPVNAALHAARTVCRRAERRCVALAEHAEVDRTSLAYLNRLSDALFVWARWAAAKLGVQETPWTPDR